VKEDLRGLVMRADVCGTLQTIEAGPDTSVSRRSEGAFAPEFRTTHVDPHWSNTTDLLRNDIDLMPSLGMGKEEN